MATCPPPSTLFPYTTLFRSAPGTSHRLGRLEQLLHAEGRSHLHPSVRDLRARVAKPVGRPGTEGSHARDRKSTRLNSSHTVISYAFFCLNKKIRVRL